MFAGSEAARGGVLERGGREGREGGGGGTGGKIGYLDEHKKFR